MSWTLFQNSMLVAGATALLATFLGAVIALCVACAPSRVRRALLGMAVVTLGLPPFLVTNCWLHLLGFTGIWRTWLPVTIYSMGGTIWILTLLTWPITLFVVMGAWEKLQAEQVELDPMMRGWVLLRHLLLPIGQPAITHAFLLTFVLAMNNFAVPAILQTKVFTEEAWVTFNTTFNTSQALLLSWPLLVPPLLLLILLPGRNFAWPRVQPTVSAALLRSRMGRGPFLIASGITLPALVFSLLPLFFLGATSQTWRQLLPAFLAGQKAFWNSFLIPVSIATVCVFAGLLCSRFRAGSIFWVAFFLPGVLLGIGLINAFNRPLFALFYHGLGIVIFGCALRYTAIAWQASRQALQSMDPELEDLANSSGVSAWQRFRHVRWPQMAQQTAAAWYIIYLFALWDVETLVLIVPPGAETLALRVFNLLHYGHNLQVNALCLLMLFLGVLPWLAWGAVRRCGRQAGLLASLLTLCAAGCTGGEGNNSVQSRFFARVEIIGSRGTGVGQFNKPRSVAVDSADNLYVTDMTGRVQKFSSNGVFVLSWQMPQTDKGKPKGMCRDANGNIIVVEPHYSRVNHFSPEGKLISQWGLLGTNAGQLKFPRSVAVSSKGNIYVSEYGLVERVQRFGPEGKEFLNSFGQPGTEPGDFSRGEGIGLDKQDRVYVADSCNHRIQVFSPEGKFIRAYGHAGIGPGEMSYPYDIRVDAEGIQYVCEFGNSRIQIFDARDQSLEILGGTGDGPTQCFNPWGIALNSAGDLYVADSGNHRVVKYIRRRG